MIVTLNNVILFKNTLRTFCVKQLFTRIVFLKKLKKNLIYSKDINSQLDKLQY